MANMNYVNKPIKNLRQFFFMLLQNKKNSRLYQEAVVVDVHWQTIEYAISNNELPHHFVSERIRNRYYDTRI